MGKEIIHASRFEADSFIELNDKMRGGLETILGTLNGSTGEVISMHQHQTEYEQQRTRTIHILWEGVIFWRIK